MADQDQPTSDAAADVATDATVKSAQFPEIARDASAGGNNRIDMILDISVPVAVQLGRAKMLIEEVLALGPGSVVELDKLAGEPVDVLVHNKIVAQGEVVVVDENFGVRITDILDPEQRVHTLR